MSGEVTTLREAADALLARLGSMYLSRETQAVADALRVALDRPAPSLVERLVDEAKQAAMRAQSAEQNDDTALEFRARGECDAYLEAARLARETEGVDVAAAAQARHLCHCCGERRHDGDDPCVSCEAAVQAERARCLDIVGELRKPGGRGARLVLTDPTIIERAAIAAALDYIANKIVEAEP